MKTIKELAKKWYILIGILIFAYIIFCKINIKEVFEILSQANFLLVFSAILLVLVMSTIHSFRWNYLKKEQNIKYSVKDSFLIYNASFLFSTITPGHIGDLLKVVYLKKDGHSVGKSLASVVLDRFGDVSVLVLIGFLSMCFFAKFFLKYIIFSSLTIFLILIIFFFFYKNELPKIIAKKILKFVVPNKYQKSWHLSYQDFINGIKTYKPKVYLILYIITIINWFIHYIAVFLLAKSIGLNVSFIYLVMSVSIATLATLIPISIFGLGTRDATLLFLFSLISISPEKTISFSVLYIVLLLSTSVIGLISWLKKPLKFKE